MWSGGLLMILFWLAVAALVIWGLKTLFLGGQSARATSPASAQEIAQMRYSRGDISRDEYLALIEDLKQTKEMVK